MGNVKQKSKNSEKSQICKKQRIANQRFRKIKGAHFAEKRNWLLQLKK